MSFKSVDLTTALRPSLLPDETLLFVQDAVGLYEGKYKIPNYQSGHAYLTSHRICYVDALEPRKFAASIELKEVDRVEYQAGFLRSSPKIIAYPKLSKRAPSQPRSPAEGLLSSQREATPSANRIPSSLARVGSPLSRQGEASAARPTWICPICSFSNTLPASFDPATANASTPISPCLACGIKPPLATLLKAAISSAVNREVPSPLPSKPRIQNGEIPTEDSSSRLPPTTPSHVSSPTSTNELTACPRCTFANHPSLRECEICGALLKRKDLENYVGDHNRSDSPGVLSGVTKLDGKEISECAKLSFREGGEKIFHERLKGALIQRKWLLYDAPPVPKAPLPMTPERTSPPVNEPNVTSGPPTRPSAVGIAGLERRGLETRKNNEAVIGNAFEDLEALMASAKEIVALAESFSADSGIAPSEGSAEATAVLSQSAAALGMITTRDMLGSGGGSESLYLSELSRNLAEYLTDDREGILRREGGIMSLIDLWAVFNRRRNGVELVSPTDFQKAAELWEKLKLPVRLRRFKSGLLVVQPHDWSDDKSIRQLDIWLDELSSVAPADEVPWDWRTYGRGISAQEAAQRFGWSVGVASEELEMAEDRGVLCREEGIEGLRFWRNHIVGSTDIIDSTGCHLSELSV